MSKRILITGGTGLLGNLMTARLQELGYHVSILSRSPDQVHHAKAFYWNIRKKEIDENCVKDIDIIIHLAGAGIADKKWTDARKQELIDSRTESISLLYNLLSRVPHSVETVISASAVGFYGDRGDETLTEQSSAGNDFLAGCCTQWESAVDKGKDYGLRVIKFRIGLLLTEEGGVLEPFKKMVNTFTAASFGNGQQWFPWIHKDDLIGMFIWAAINPEVNGVYNAVAPNPVRNHEFTKQLSKTLNKPFWPFHIPPFLLNIILGERKELLLMSNRVSSKKIEEQGYNFQFVNLVQALVDITRS